MVSIQGLARNHFGQDVTKKRPTQAFNSSGQLELDYENTINETINIVFIRNRLSNQQTSKEGVKQVFPAKIFGDISLDVKDFDLITTATETFQVTNAQIKATNITGTIGSDPGYFYADLTYFDHDVILEN